MATIKIDPEFKSLIPPLAPEELEQLEANLVADGCRDPLVLWQGILLDGHNRHWICIRRGIPYKTTSVELKDRDAAIEWIILNQFGRRNITTFTRGELALRLEPIIAARAKAAQARKPKSVLLKSGKQKPIHVDKELAKIAGVSADTIAKTRDVQKHASEETKTALRTSKDKSLNRVAKEVKETRRKAKQVAKERDAAKTVPAGNAWTLTADQAVIPCAALITDPPYGILDEPWEPRKLEEFTRCWARRWEPCGADFIAVFWSQRHLWTGRELFDDCFRGYHFRQLLVWHYANNKSPQSRDGFKQTWEPIFFYRRNDSTKKVTIGGGTWGESLTDFDCHCAAVPQSNFNDQNRKVHPAQKPVSVMAWLVNALTVPGELVIDPFCGSGTTGIAALQLGRRFHGIETDSKFLELAKGRIASYGKQV